MGWWEADFSKKQYVCSDFLRELLDLGEDGIINFVDFRKLIREDYRLRTVNEFRFGKTQNIYDQIYPIEVRGKIVWVRVKLCSKEVDAEGNMRTCGFMECLDVPENMDTEETAMERVNNLFAQQNSISRSLLSLLRSGDMSSVINKILGDIMQHYPEGCTYIIEYDWENRTQTCRYEAGNYKSFKKKNYMEKFPMSNIPWWTKQLAGNASPIIFASLDELPDHPCVPHGWGMRGESVQGGDVPKGTSLFCLREKRVFGVRRRLPGRSEETAARLRLCQRC